MRAQLSVKLCFHVLKLFNNSNYCHWCHHQSKILAFPLRQSTTRFPFLGWLCVLKIRECETAQATQRRKYWSRLGSWEGWKKNWQQSKPSIMNELKAFHIVLLCLSFMFTRNWNWVFLFAFSLFVHHLAHFDFFFELTASLFTHFFLWMRLPMLWESSWCTHTSESWMLWNAETIVNSFRHTISLHMTMFHPCCLHFASDSSAGNRRGPSPLRSIDDDVNDLKTKSLLRVKMRIFNVEPQSFLYLLSCWNLISAPLLMISCCWLY